MSQEKKFYVYLHRYASGPKEGQVFYVGKGQGRRAFNKNRKYNEHWTRVHLKHGFIVEIVMRFTSEACAFSFERALIKYYGRGNLCNLTDGGEGLSGCSEEVRAKLRSYHVGDKSYRFDHKIYEFENIDGRLFTGTRYELRSFDVPENQITNMVAGRLQHTHGWFLKGCRPKEKKYMKGKNHYALDRRVFRFVRNDGQEFVGIRFDFCKKYGVDTRQVGAVLSGKSKTVKGWAVYEL